MVDVVSMSDAPLVLRKGECIGPKKRRNSLLLTVRQGRAIVELVVWTVASLVRKE